MSMEMITYSKILPNENLAWNWIYELREIHKNDLEFVELSFFYSSKWSFRFDRVRVYVTYYQKDT